LQSAAFNRDDDKLAERPRRQRQRRSCKESYQIALPATYLRRCGGFVTSVQAFDLTHVYDAIAPHNVG